MYIEPLVLYGLISVILILFGIVFYTLFTRGESKSVPKSVDDQAQEEIMTAHRESRVVIDKAAEKAQELLLDAEYIKSDLSSSMEESIRTIADNAIVSFQNESQELHKQYKVLFQDIRKRYVDEVEKTVKSIDSLADEELKSFQKIIKDETVSSQDKVEKRAEAVFVQAQKEIETYKAQKVQEIDAQVKDMLGKVFSNVLQKSLSDEDHQKLVMNALESAKKEGFLAHSEAAVKNGTQKSVPSN